LEGFFQEQGRNPVPLGMGGCQAFPSHWNSSDLMADLAWFTACMPKHIHCRYAERKENRLVFSFNLQSSTRAEHNMKLAFNICRTRLAFVLKEDLP
jgi:hypothetical protein